MIQAFNNTATGFQKSSSTRSGAEILSHVLSDTYHLLLKTQTCHWNVSGPVYVSLCVMFEEQYQDMFAAIEELAERIRGLGESVPTNFLNISQKSHAGEKPSHVDYQEMICNLGFATHAVIERLRDFLMEVEESGDLYTQEFLIRRLRAHERNLWVLQSFLQ